jgi:glycosyltransferase involved in cell wall biosynthesis
MRIVLASHISDLSGPTEALIEYLTMRKWDILAILNPLEYSNRKKRSVVTIAKGKNIGKVEPLNLKHPAIVSWMLDWIFVFWFSLFWQGTVDVFIGCDPLNASVGVILKKIGKVKKLVYYNIDWSERRFREGIINSIYYALDHACVRQCDVNWCVTDSLIQLRKKQGADSIKLLLVPVGVESEGIPDPLTVRYDQHALVFLGAFEKTKGIELVISAWPVIKKKDPQARLIVIGKTPKGITEVPYEDRLIKLEGVEVLGVIGHNEVLNKLPYYGIGLAPYAPDADSVTKYADPSRIKDYLACGLPVITTDVPNIAKVIAAMQAGVIVRYDKHQFVESVIRMMNSDSYGTYRTNALRFARKFRWKDIYNVAFHSSYIV